jgi:hypothetical protein
MMKNSLLKSAQLLKTFCEESDFLWEYGGLSHGFLDGGCMILSDVIMSINESVLEDKKIFFVGREWEERSKIIVDHVAVGFIINGSRIFLDANGLQSEDELIENLRDELSPHDTSNIIVDVFNEQDDEFMEDVMSSGFGLYEELDLVRNQLIQKLDEIGFIQCLREAEIQKYASSVKNNTSLEEASHDFKKNCIKDVNSIHI